MTHHSIMSYQERILTYMTSLARARSPRQLSSAALDQEVASQNMTSLFTPTGQSEAAQGSIGSGSLDARALDAVGRALGTAAQVRRIRAFRLRKVHSIL